MGTTTPHELTNALGITDDSYDKLKSTFISTLERQDELDRLVKEQQLAVKQEIARQMYETEKQEMDENGRRLTRKPNRGFKLGSYNSKHRKFKQPIHYGQKQPKDI